MKALLKVTMIVGALAFAGTASANNYGSTNYGYSGAPVASGSVHYAYQPGPLDDRSGYRNLKGASETASFNFRKGVNAYQKNNLEKAEKSFKTALRADYGGLEAGIYLYLANISKTSGDLEEAAVFAQKYFEMTTSK